MRFVSTVSMFKWHLLTFAVSLCYNNSSSHYKDFEVSECKVFNNLNSNTARVMHILRGLTSHNGIITAHNLHIVI